MQPENLGREGSPSIMEVSLYFASILRSENKPRVVRFKDLTSSYLLHIAGPSLYLPWSCALDGGRRGRRLLSWGGMMVRSRGERGPWENETSPQHSGGGVTCTRGLGTWRLGGGRMRAHVRWVFLPGPFQPLPCSVEKTVSSMVRE